MPTPLHQPATSIQAARHHTSLLGPLIAAGYQWRTATAGDHPAIEQLIWNATGTRWSMTAGHHATVATIHDSTVVATAVLSTSDDTVTIEHLAVGHPHRGQGLATILLHSIPHLAEQALTNPPTLYTGTCPARAAGLYARCGYTVLPHSPIDPTRCTFTKTPGWH